MMSVTVKTAHTSRPFEWHSDKDGVHALMWSADLSMRIEYNGAVYDCVVRFSGRDDLLGGPCFRCDGLSVPVLFRWFLPSWDKKNELYNIAGAVHDWLYATKGANEFFTREECDDIFRGILREAGVGRFKAGVADVMVGLFAGCGLHWGNDSLGVASSARLEFL
jgi:hypothetical protein